MEIRNLMENGVSISEISRMLGVDRKTAKKYGDLDVYNQYFKNIKKKRKLEPYKEHIQNRLEKYPLSAVRLYDEIKSMGYQGKLSILRDFIREYRNEKTYHAVKMFETEPGQQAQVDWGYFGKINTNEGIKELYGFLMILGYSRQRYAEFTYSMDLPTFIKCHVNGFKYFGGAPNEILYDNMKQVVLRRGVTSDSSDFTPLFMDFCAYYGIKPKLCRVMKPRTKGKVEKLVDYVKDNFFLGLEFTDLIDINIKARAWMEKVNSQPHSTTKEAPGERLKKEQPLLIKIKERPDYRISEKLYRKARSNCMVSVYSSEYSVSPKYANRDVEVILEEESVRIFYRGNEIAYHKRVNENMVSFLDSHKKEIEKNCFYMPKENKIKREPNQVSILDQPVEKRDLTLYEEVSS